MTGGELGFRKTGSFNLREEAARAILRPVWLQGHRYVELREDGKRLIFFCTLCRTPCYSDSALFDHLNGNLHSRRYASAKITLFGSLPWPFNDGVLFFFDSSQQEKQLAVSNDHGRILNAKDDNMGLILDGYDKRLNATGLNLGLSLNCHSISLNNVDDKLEQSLNGHEKNLSARGNNLGLSLNGFDRNSNEIEQRVVVGLHMVIPEVLLKDELSTLRIRLIGFGHIASRVRETDEIADRVVKIWCAWLGDANSGDRKVESMLSMPECDFGIVTFSYTYGLGRKGVEDAFSPLLSSSPGAEKQEITSTGRKRKTPLVEFEDISEASGDSQMDSTDKTLSLQMFQADNDSISTGCDDRFKLSRAMSSKAARKELRRRQRLASERLCGVCQQRMLPGKDVATLLNRNTGNLACRSRNKNGAFHVFHTSCLIHWILLCESELWIDQLSGVKTAYKSIDSVYRGDSEGNFNRRRIIDEEANVGVHLSSVFCPECQGTGLNIEDQLEGPRIPLAQMFLYYIKVAQSHKAWMDHPELLQNCSTGLHFFSGSDNNSQEKVLPLKLLHFYQADE